MNIIFGDILIGYKSDDKYYNDLVDFFDNYLPKYLENNTDIINIVIIGSIFYNTNNLTIKNLCLFKRIFNKLCSFGKIYLLDNSIYNEDGNSIFDLINFGWINIIKDYDILDNILITKGEIPDLEYKFILSDNKKIKNKKLISNLEPLLNFKQNDKASFYIINNNIERIDNLSSIKWVELTINNIEDLLQVKKWINDILILNIDNDFYNKNKNKIDVMLYKFNIYKINFINFEEVKEEILVENDDQEFNYDIINCNIDNIVEQVIKDDNELKIIFNDLKKYNKDE